jgi:hypothetical protein
VMSGLRVNRTQRNCPRQQSRERKNRYLVHPNLP